jgi:hypothetical protein
MVMMLVDRFGDVIDVEQLLRASKQSWKTKEGGRDNVR